MLYGSGLEKHSRLIPQKFDDKILALSKEVFFIALEWFSVNLTTHCTLKRACLTVASRSTRGSF